MRRRSSWFSRASFPAILIVMFALNGCGTPSGSSKPSMPTLQQILSRAASVELRDATVKITETSTTSMGTSNIAMEGTSTKSPDRADLTMTRTSTSGRTSEDEVIFDGATHTMYLKTLQPAILASDKWTRGPTLDLGGFGADFATAYLTNPEANAKDTTLVGAERVNNLDMWHLKSTTVANGLDLQRDVYLRQDTYVPVRVVGHTTNQSGSVDLTCDYNTVNTGVSIVLPAPQDIEAS